jgi:hypothetical protein
MSEGISHSILSMSCNKSWQQSVYLAHMTKMIGPSPVPDDLVQVYWNRQCCILLAAIDVHLRKGVSKLLEKRLFGFLRREQVRS